VKLYAFRHPEHAAQVEVAVGIGQAEGVLGGQREALRGIVVGDIAVAGHRRQPLACVPLVDVRPARERGARQRACLGEDAKEAEAITGHSERPHINGDPVTGALCREVMRLLHIECRYACHLCAPSVYGGCVHILRSSPFPMPAQARSS